MNTFLFTTSDCNVATTYGTNTDRNTSVFFQITVKDPTDLRKIQVFARIDKYSHFQDEKKFFLVWYISIN